MSVSCSARCNKISTVIPPIQKSDWDRWCIIASGTTSIEGGRVFYNRWYGGLMFTEEFETHYKELGLSDERDSNEFIKCLDEYGREKAQYHKPYYLEVVSIPPFHDWRMLEYDGRETVEINFRWKDLTLVLLNPEKCLLDPNLEPLARAYAAKSLEALAGISLTI